MIRISLRAVISIIIATGLLCVALLAGKSIATSLADRGDPAIATQTSTLVSTAEAQPSMLNKSNSPAGATRYFEPFWLLVLGATLLAIGTSIKRIAKAEAKTPLSGSESKRAL